MTSTGYPDYLGGFQQPSPLFVSSSDVLRVAAASSQGSETITVNYRLLLDTRQIYNGQFTVSPASDRTITTHDEPMQNGFLLSVSCKAAVATTRGQTFLRAFITNAVFGTGEPALMLMSDYVTTRMAATHPNGRILSTAEGPGYLRLVNIANPAANADWSFTVPTNARWRLLSLCADLDTDATAGNRNVRLLVEPAGGGTLTLNWRFVVGPSLTTELNMIPGATFTVGATGQAGFNFAIVPLVPDMLMIAGGKIYSATAWPGGTNQWYNISMHVEEWLDNV